MVYLARSPNHRRARRPSTRSSTRSGSSVRGRSRTPTKASKWAPYPITEALTDVTGEDLESEDPLEHSPPGNRLHRFFLRSQEQRFLIGSTYPMWTERQLCNGRIERYGQAEVGVCREINQEYF